MLECLAEKRVVVTAAAAGIGKRAVDWGSVDPALPTFEEMPPPKAMEEVLCDGDGPGKEKVT